MNWKHGIVPLIVSCAFAVLLGPVLSRAVSSEPQILDGVPVDPLVGPDIHSLESATIAMTKTVGTDPSVCATTDEIDVAEGTAATYCFRVTNTGPVALTRHSLEDSHLGSILSDFGFLLPPNATIWLTQTAIITQTTANTATWTGFNPGPVDVALASDSATVNVVPPQITLTKTVGTDPSVCAATDEIDVAKGTAATYCFRVTNTGPVTLSLHTLEDSHLGSILSDFGFLLPPDATIFLTQTAIITQTTANTATWTGFNPGPVDVAIATDSATVKVLRELYLPLVLKE